MNMNIYYLQIISAPSLIGQGSVPLRGEFARAFDARKFHRLLSIFSVLVDCKARQLHLFIGQGGQDGHSSIDICGVWGRAARSFKIWGSRDPCTRS